MGSMRWPGISWPPTKCQATAPAASKRAIARADSASIERLLGTLAAEGCAGPPGVATFASACAPTSQRIDTDRLGDVLELGQAKVAHLQIESAFDLTISVLGQTDRAGLGDAFKTRSDIDAVAHEVAVALLDDIAEMNADPELDALLRRHVGVALDHSRLDFDRAAHGVDDAAELDDRAVAGALDDAAVVHGNDRVDQVAAKRPEPRQRAVLVGAGEPAIAGDIGHQNRRELPGLAHCAALRDSS